jgi:L-aminopeptidase/D-esterase-like protein
MTRSRDLGIPFEGTPGPYNAITDIEGVTVGHTTLIFGHGELKVRHGPVRTGVTAVLPRGKSFDPPFAAWYPFNGNGEITGVTWLEESGFLESPILTTNTHSIGAVHEATAEWMHQNRYFDPEWPILWTLPVVSETADMRLNDMNGFHVRREHVFEALNSACSGPVQEGNVGGGTGMVSYEFKSGIGTASRVTSIGYRVGALVQANYGTRRQLVIAGVPVGLEIPDLIPRVRLPDLRTGAGSIIGIIATDAPLLPHQLMRLIRRAPLGMARLGGIGANTSGDLFIAFSTANTGIFSARLVAQAEFLSNDEMDPLFEATVQVVEEAIVNSLVAAETMMGINDNIVYALPHDRLQAAMRKYGRLIE